MPISSNATISRFLARADLLFTMALFGTVLLLVLPVPPFAIDALLALNIGLSLLVLLAIVYVKEPPEFSGFPTILLALTL
ncbi:MAG: FHIPEP family type III secretion protein, partial [Candidatus Didemnitutus sp.]|nr:FHIPEP family type III secretion protein [Candidatus Didemnitutus sp.]